MDEVFSPALILVSLPSLTDRIAVSGGTESTVHVSEAGDGSLFVELSTDRTLKVWLPSARVIEKIRIKDQSLLELNNEITALTDKLAKAKSIHRQNEMVTIKLNELESQRVTFENDLMNKKEQLAIRRADQESNLKQIETLNKKICELEVQADKIIFTDQVGAWLNQHFIPSLVQIESQVLISVKEEFNKLFQKWFYLLIEVSDIDAEIDEYFTPVVNQNGYRLEVESLSGGEKTSVALAYRLALNEIIRRIIMLDDNLLILDEPTDGFSKEQLVQIKHGFQIVAQDKVGNKGSIPSSFNWTTDTEPPSTSIFSATAGDNKIMVPGSNTSSNSVTFEFSANDTGGSEDKGVGIKQYECSLDKSNFSTCSSPVKFSSTYLKDGSHGLLIHHLQRLLLILPLTVITKP